MASGNLSGTYVQPEGETSNLPPDIDAEVDSLTIEGRFKIFKNSSGNFEIKAVGQQQAVFKFGPENDGTVTPTESTHTFYLSKAGSYDLYVDLTLNRLANADYPVFGAMMVATDGQNKPKFFLHSSTDYGATYVKHVEMDPADRLWKFNDMTAMTADGGFAVKLTNHTGGSTYKGQVLRPSGTYANSVSKADIDGTDPIGVAYDVAADGADVWVVVWGIAYVYYVNDTALRNYARVCRTGDSGEATGKAFADSVAPDSSAKHLGQLGHLMEAITGPGLAKTALNIH